MKPQTFSWSSRFKSFRYAWEGISSFLQSEHNAWIHFMCSIVVMTLAVLIHVSTTELLALVFAIGFVWVAEMFNTCIERMLDFVSPERHPEIKFIKDLAAGAVLVAALVSVVVAIVVFIPKLFSL
jgi:diacylglycerol kinase (ATP)